jgi:hypothetical protein
MSVSRRVFFVPRLLFALTVGLALALGGMVLLAPELDPGGPPADGWPHLVAVFARDAVVRRITAASALGLLVTAFVFFRPSRFGWGGRRPPRVPRSRNAVGA